MPRQDGLSQWMQTVSTQMPHLSRPHARVLALWSYGMVVTQSCGLTTVAAFLALLLGKRPGALRQQLREWCYAAADKKGRQRRAVEVAPCFGALLRWVLAWWPAQERRLALAMDATTLGQRFTVLALSVVYRGCAIPVAWVVVPALAPEVADVAWYGMRTWIECGFKDSKRGGWQWQQTKMTDPERASRLWLAIAVATLWVVSVGGEADATLPASSLEELPAPHVARQRERPQRRSRPRLLSCFRRGVLGILVALITGQDLPLGRFRPEPLPTRPALTIAPL